MSDRLYIVIPAYNEEQNIETVVKEWHEVADRAGEDSRLVVIDDGSKDATYEKLQKLAENYPQLIPVTKKNSGHGATILYGYQYAVEQKADYVFQTDSDGQTLPNEFWPLWEARQDYDAQIGDRKGRQDGFSRVVVTKVLKFVLLLSFGKQIADANTPFRLMSAASLQRHMDKIPKDYNLSNVLLTVLYEKAGDRIRYVPITFRCRQGGVNSINMRRITRIGWRALKDFMTLRKTI